MPHAAGRGERAEEGPFPLLRKSLAPATCDFAPPSQRQQVLRERRQGEWRDVESDRRDALRSSRRCVCAVRVCSDPARASGRHGRTLESCRIPDATGRWPGATRGPPDSAAIQARGGERGWKGRLHVCGSRELPLSVRRGAGGAFQVPAPVGRERAREKSGHRGSGGGGTLRNGSAPWRADSCAAVGPGPRGETAVVSIAMPHDVAEMTLSPRPPTRCKADGEKER